jgi:hypothetical protein
LSYPLFLNALLILEHWMMLSNACVNVSLDVALVDTVVVLIMYEHWNTVEKT